MHPSFNHHMERVRGADQYREEAARQDRVGGGGGAVEVVVALRRAAKAEYNSRT